MKEERLLMVLEFKQHGLERVCLPSQLVFAPRRTPLPFAAFLTWESARLTLRSMPDADTVLDRGVRAGGVRAKLALCVGSVTGERGGELRARRGVIFLHEEAKKIKNGTNLLPPMLPVLARRRARSVRVRGRARERPEVSS